MGRKRDHNARYLTHCRVLSIIIILTFLLTTLSHNIEVNGGSNNVQWSSPTGGQHHTLRSPYNAKNTMGGKEWEVGLDARAVSTPVIGVDGLVYVSTQNQGSDPAGLHCLNSDGEVIWAKLFDSEKIVGPVIENDGNLIIAYEERDAGSFIVRYSPYGEQLLIRSIEGIPHLDPVLDEEGNIYLIIKTTHTEYSGGYWGYERTIENYNLTKYTPGLIDMWEFHLSKLGTSINLPTITPGGFIAVNGYDLFFLSPEGEIVWSDPEIGTDHPILYFDNRLFIVTGSVVCYDLEGNRKWVNGPNHGYMESTIALTSDNGLVFFDDDYYIYKLNLDGSMVWEKDIQSTGYSNPLCSSDGYIFGTDDYDVIKFDNKGNRLLNTDYLDIPEGGWEENFRLALSSDGSLYFSAESGIAKFKGIDISAHVTFAWVSLIFITIGMTIGALVLYQKTSISVIRKRSVPLPYPHMSSGGSLLQCPECQGEFVPDPVGPITCPYCGERDQG